MKLGQRKESQQQMCRTERGMHPLSPSFPHEIEREKKKKLADLSAYIPLQLI